MDLTLTIDIVAFFALAVSILSLILSWWTGSKYSQLIVFNEYTKRYQEIVLKLYTDPNNIAYHKSYFDLCCLEHILNTENLLPSKIWKSWVHEMKQIMKKEEIRASWEKQKSNYDKQEDFKIFFEDIVTKSKTIK